MTCQEVIEFVMAYLDNELPTREREVFADHLCICPSCKNYLDSYARTVDLSRLAAASPGESAFGKVPEELVRAIGIARQRRA